MSDRRRGLLADSLDFAKGGLLGLSTDVLGAPVDMAAMAMRPFGYGVAPEQTIGSSDWIASKLGANASGSIPETAGRLATGLLTPSPMDVARAGGLLAALPAAAKASRVVSGEGDDLVRMYHGTDAAGREGIEGSGRIRGPAFFTPDEGVARHYGGGDEAEIIEAIIPRGRLMIDADLPGGRLLSVDEANDYLGNEGWSIMDYIRSGHSVGIPDDVYLK